MDDEEEAPVEVITVDSDSDTGGTITIRSDNKNMIRQRPPSPIPTLEESFQLMAERFKYLEEKIKVEKCPDNTFCISCLAVKRAYNHGCLQTPWKEAFENAFLGVSILNSTFVDHCWDVSAQSAGPDAVYEKRKVKLMRTCVRDEDAYDAQEMNIFYRVDSAQDTSHAFNNIEVPISKKDNDQMIHRYLQTYESLQWLKHSDIPMTKTMSRGPKVTEYMFCIFCYKLHHIDAEECPSKENEREAVRQLHAKSSGISMLNKEVVEAMLEFFDKKHEYHLKLKNKKGPFIDSPQEEKPGSGKPVTDAEMQKAFNQIHKSLMMQNGPIDKNRKDYCFQCSLPRNCQCPNGPALKQAAQKFWEITEDIQFMDGDLKKRCADFALYEAGIHEKNVEAIQLSESLRDFAKEMDSSEYVSSDEETRKRDKKKSKRRIAIQGPPDDISSDDNADECAPSTSNQSFHRYRRSIPGPSDPDIEIVDEYSDHDELADEKEAVSNVEAETSFRKILIVLNEMDIGAPTISWNRFCKNYRTLYSQNYPGPRNEADIFAKNAFRKIRNRFEAMNKDTLKLFKGFTFVNTIKYGNLCKIDKLRQSKTKKDRKTESDQEADPGDDGDDEKEEEIITMDSDDNDEVNPAEPMKRKVGRPQGWRKSRTNQDPVVRLRGKRRPRCLKTKKADEPPKKKSKNIIGGRGSR
ncbi:hypothetical protein L5515_015627 [Caenorhabditis briggsae]|uniref:Uncharacterized protein n=2 Tax=Caenorhabditis briggsae TaxID=6238 RepID=A0AAE9J9I1_CAEBR|nr:hypothetical protein L5515_015627 [Caenorhabditis briggsae]